MGPVLFFPEGEVCLVGEVVDGGVCDIQREAEVGKGLLASVGAGEDVLVRGQGGAGFLVTLLVAHNGEGVLVAANVGGAGGDDDFQQALLLAVDIANRAGRGGADGEFFVGALEEGRATAQREKRENGQDRRDNFHQYSFEKWGAFQGEL